jgi:hypothetical protein
MISWFSLHETVKLTVCGFRKRGCTPLVILATYPSFIQFKSDGDNSAFLMSLYVLHHSKISFHFSNLHHTSCLSVVYRNLSSLKSLLGVRNFLFERTLSVVDGNLSSLESLLGVGNFLFDGTLSVMDRNLSCSVSRV